MIHQGQSYRINDKLIMNEDDWLSDYIYESVSILNDDMT